MAVVTVVPKLWNNCDASCGTSVTSAVHLLYQYLFAILNVKSGRKLCLVGIFNA